MHKITLFSFSRTISFHKCPSCSLSSHPSPILHQSRRLSHQTSSQELLPVFFSYTYSEACLQTGCSKGFKIFYVASLFLIFQQLRTLLSKFEVKFNTEDEENLIKKTNMSTERTMKCLNIEAWVLPLNEDQDESTSTARHTAFSLLYVLRAYHMEAPFRLKSVECDSFQLVY